MASKESIIDNLYDICQDRTMTTKQVLTKFLIKENVVPSNSDLERLEDIIRPYKNNGKNLEQTANAIYDILNQPKGQTWG